MGELMGLRAIVYGAGNYGFQIATEIEMIQCDILYYVDRNYADKSKLGRYDVKSIDHIIEDDYDIIIIALNKWREVYDYLSKDLDVNSSKIRIYDIHSKKRVLTVEDKIYLENQITVDRINIKTCVQNELLYEAWKAGEFCEVDTIYAFGSEEYFGVLIQFIKSLNHNIRLKSVNQLMFDITSKDKILFVDSDYKERYLEMKKQGKLTSSNWCIIPLFDVEDAINI